MIGETIYVFDINRRRYPPKVNGIMYSRSPIWREHWRPEKVAGQTSRSWVTEYGTKVPKKGANPHLFLFTLRELDEAAWAHEHRYKIADEVKRLSIAGLKKVAGAMNYTPQIGD